MKKQRENEKIKDEVILDETVEEATQEAKVEGEAPEKEVDELAEAKSQLLRALAEYDNYRKRSTKEKESAFTNGICYAVEKLIPVLDTLAMAEAAPCADEEYKKGITLTIQKAQNAFEALGVNEIVAEGEMFDPELHAAVMQEQGEESGKIMKVFQKGYKIGDKVVRHSSVSVSE